MLRKDFYILINNIKLILRNPLRLLPYAGLLGYFSFFYWQRTKKREEEGVQDIQNLDLEGLPETDFAMQNIVGGATILALIFFALSLVI